MKIFKLFIFFAFLFSCFFNGVFAVSDSQSTFDWENKRPIDLIELLKKSKTPSYMVTGIHNNWVKKKHLAGLIELIDSSVRCANVASMWSSYMDSDWSTVGNEAAYLIEGYRAGKYPPRLNSTRPKPEREDILKWWKNFK